MMTLHPLTKELLSARFEYPTERDQAFDKIVREYLTGRAEWLKKKLEGNVVKGTYRISVKELKDGIDHAFRLAPETLEEKFKAIRQKHSDCNPDFWSDLLTEFVAATEEHFAPKPSEASDKTPPLHLRTQPGWKG